MINEEKFISVTDSIKNNKDFVAKIEREKEVLVLSKNKPLYVALSFEYYKQLNDELEYLREYEKINPRLNEIESTNIDELKTHEELKEEGLFG